MHLTQSDTIWIRADRQLHQKLNNDWGILMAYQPVQSYFMPKN